MNCHTLTSNTFFTITCKLDNVQIYSYICVVYLIIDYLCQSQSSSAVPDSQYCSVGISFQLFPIVVNLTYKSDRLVLNSKYEYVFEKGRY